MYLKKSDGSVFGPVDDDIVVQWAREGRIVPGDALSSDNAEWIEPSSVDALGLDWFIPLNDGEPYGPVHALVLSDFINDGSLGLDDTVAHKTTRDVRRVCEVLTPALQRYAASLRDTLIEEQSRTEKLATPSSGPDAAKTADLLRSQLAIARQSLTDRDAEIEKLRQQFAEQQTLARKLADDLAARTATTENLRGDDIKTLERFRAEAKSLRALADEREKEILRLKQTIDTQTSQESKIEAELRARIKELQASELTLLKTLESEREKTAKTERKTASGAVTTGGSDYASIVQSYDDLSKNYDLLMEQFAAKSSDLATAYAAAEKLKKEFEDRLARLEETLKTERADATTARARLSKSEEAHLELVRSYRDLNDRYVRYRQKMESPAAPAAAAPGGNTATGTDAGAKPKVRLV